jgi:hypothetical protein
VAIPSPGVPVSGNGFSWTCLPKIWTSPPEGLRVSLADGGFWRLSQQ